jgi:hypothetical protein
MSQLRAYENESPQPTVRSARNTGGRMGSGQKKALELCSPASPCSLEQRQSMLCLGPLLCSCADNLIRQVVLGKQMWPLAGTGGGLQHAASTTARAHLPMRDKAGKKKGQLLHTGGLLLAVNHVNENAVKLLVSCCTARPTVDQPAHVARIKQPRER